MSIKLLVSEIIIYLYAMSHYNLLAHAEAWLKPIYMTRAVDALVYMPLPTILSALYEVPPTIQYVWPSREQVGTGLNSNGYMC